MKGFSVLKDFQNLKFKSSNCSEIESALSMLKTLGYSECESGFNVSDAVKDNGFCAWDDGELTEGWLKDGAFKSVTLEDLKEMVYGNTNNKVLWLNKDTLEERMLHEFFCFNDTYSWVRVPEGATFATGDKYDFVFRKDGHYYEDCEWVETNVQLKHFPEYKKIKLFWVKSDVKENMFTLERLLGCEVNFTDPFGMTVNGHISKVRNSGLVNVVCKSFNGVVGVKNLTLFTEDGGELTFDEYVNMYYGDN